MAGSRLSTLCRHFTAVAADTAADADLLARFTASRDEAAFAALVKRHGPMVWGVCRNLLPSAADADDAFQATFLALVRGATTVRKPEALGAWLHGVAVRVANKLRRAAARRAQREKKVAASEAVRPVADSQWDSVLAAVHEEVSRLPDGERTAFVVCCLEGVRQPDAAAQLGWKPGTLTGRLAKAKQRLLDRLTRRGLAPAVALGALGLGASTGQAVVPAKLLDAAAGLASATAAVPASVLQLSHGVLDMTITKVKLLAAAVLVAGGLATGFGAGFFANADAQYVPPGIKKAPVPDDILVQATPATTPPAAPPGGLPPAAGSGAPGPGFTPVAPKAASNQPAVIPGAPSAMGGMPMAGGVARGPITRPYEYKFVDVAAMKLDQLKKTLADEGNLGWELATIEHTARPDLGSPGYDVAIFKRAKQPVMGSPTGMPGMGGPPIYTPSAIPPGAPATETAPSPASANDPVNLYRSLERPPTASVPGGGSPAPAGPKLHTITLSWGNSVQTAKVLKELIAIGEFNNEVTAVIADEGSNSLLVKATESGRKLLEKQVEQLEKAAAERAAERAKKEEESSKVRPSSGANPARK